jgi:hypothetical protein
MPFIDVNIGFRANKKVYKDANWKYTLNVEE